MRTGMLRPMKSNDMIRLSLGRLIVTNRGSAPNRAIVPRRVRRLRYATSTAIANPAVTNSSAINQRRWLPSFPSQISAAGSVSWSDRRVPEVAGDASPALPDSAAATIRCPPH